MSAAPNLTAAAKLRAARDLAERVQLDDVAILLTRSEADHLLNRLPPSSAMQRSALAPTKLKGTR